MNLSWLSWICRVLVLLRSLAAAEEDGPKMVSDKFNLKWYGPQASSNDCPEFPGPQNYRQKTLLVFDKVPYIDQSTFSLTMSGHGVGMVYVEGSELREVKVEEMLNQSQVLNFTEYMHMEPEDNQALVTRYFNPQHTIIEIFNKLVRPQMRPDPWHNMVMDMYLAYPSVVSERLTIRVLKDGVPVLDETGFQIDAPLTFLIYEDPRMGTMSPSLGPSQGGSNITITGSNFPTHFDRGRGEGYSFPFHYQPLLRFTASTVVTETAIDGYVTEGVYFQQQFFDLDPYWSNALAHSGSPPQLLNDTDAILNCSLALSFNRQDWFDFPDGFTFYDPTRIGYYQVLTLAQSTERKVLWAGGLRKMDGNGQNLLMAIPEQAKDTNKLWMILPPHGAPKASAGIPIQCGGRLRIQHVRTMKNMHSSYEDSPTLHQQDSSIYGTNGHGDSGDDWVLECENNLEHDYPYDWQDLVWDKRLHAERFDLVLRNKNRYWHVDTPVRLRHERTSKYLTMTGFSLSKDFCADCLEKRYASVTATVDQAGNHQRWFVKRVIDVPVECPVLPHQVHETLAKRWKVHPRLVSPSDFVLWRTKGGSDTHACDVDGEFRVGKVLQLFRTTGMITVNEYFLQRGVYEQIKTFEAPKNAPVYHTISMSFIHGPLVTTREHDADASIGDGHKYKPGVRERVRAYVELVHEHQGLMS